MENLILKKGRDNLAVTVFVPYDCNNNCHFCTSKSMYRNCTTDKTKILNIIKNLNKVDIKEFVITGGEPFSDLDFLQEMIDNINIDKDIYINTTLPIIYPTKEILSFIKYNKKIKGLNISRHSNLFIEDIKIFNSAIFNDDLISMIEKPVKINCVIQNNLSIPQLLERWNKVENCRLSLRRDYTKINNSNLKTLKDDVINTLTRYCTYIDHSGCDVCFDVRFSYDKLNVSYHRGLELSSIQIGNTIIINDIIVKPNGEIYYDWDDKTIPNLLNTLENEWRVKSINKKRNTNSYSCGSSSHC